MNIIRYIYVIAIAAIVASCSLAEFDQPVNDVIDGSALQIVGRVIPFIEQNVQTKAEGKSFDESSTYSMCLAVFGSDNKCKDVRYSEGSNITFTVEKEKLNNGDKFYVFANILNPELGTGKTLEEYMAVTVPVNGVVDFPTLTLAETGKTEKCLPMMGTYEVVDKNSLPSIIPIPLESLYAKIAVTINVTPDQKIDGVDPASFTFDGFEVHNVASVVDFIGGTPGITNDEVAVYEEVFKGQLASHANNIAQGNRSVSFACYLPERFLKPEVKAEDYGYPFGKISDLDPNEVGRYPQRYKPLLVEDKNATFVRILGEFIDHQTHHYKVSYDIYVGKDNYGNFDIERNKQYNNSITIKGVSTSNNMTNDDQSISIDHRVDVLFVEPILVNLRRETLLDSHFEVRPLRIRKNPDYTGQVTNASVKVEVIYKDQADNKWIGLERSFGNGEKMTDSNNTYLVDSDLPANKKNIAGKRKYFTTDLTTNTLGTMVEDIPVTEDGECVWIYVDEAKVDNAKDGKRAAVIRISYMVNGSVYGEPLDYTINQQELFPVTYSDATTSANYLIEYHEEYLHDYDSDDLYGQTEYEGMVWGLPNEQLSTQLYAILISKGTWSSVDASLKEQLQKNSPKYDFYLSRDVDYENWSFNSESDYYNLVHDRNGYNFCNKIISKVSNIGVMTLAEQPESAVEYCYNRNKRQADGTITAAEFLWYLPAIDEIEEIVMSTYGETQYSYSRFPSFRENMYWSCQPAYLNNYVFVDRNAGDRYGNYMIDDINRARATSVSYSNITGGGPSDSDNYTPIASGSSGYTKYIDADYTELFVTGWFSNTEEHDVQGGEHFIGKNNKEDIDHTLTKSTPQAGNLHRTNDKARVRCVRKMN